MTQMTSVNVKKITATIRTDDGRDFSVRETGTFYDRGWIIEADAHLFYHRRLSEGMLRVSPGTKHDSNQTHVPLCRVKEIDFKVEDHFIVIPPTISFWQSYRAMLSDLIKKFL